MSLAYLYRGKRYVLLPSGSLNFCYQVVFYLSSILVFQGLASFLRLKQSTPQEKGPVMCF